VPHPPAESARHPSGDSARGPASAAALLLEQLPTLPARLGRTVLIAIDGRSGAGKSTLAAQVSEATGGVVVELEYLYPGWDGLEAGVQIAADEVLAPVSLGQDAVIPQWDWRANEWGRPLRLSPPNLLILEGVGAASKVIRRWSSLTVWLELGEADRLRRAKGRGWETYEGHWEQWARQEESLLRREGLPQAADRILPG